MTKRRLLCLFLCILFGYLFIQLMLYIYSGKEDHSDQLAVKYSSRSVIKASLQNFVDAAHKFGIPLILLDPRILLRIRQNAISNITLGCRFLCEEHGTILFGVLHHLWQHDESALAFMRTQGFSVIYTKERDVDTLNYLGFVEGSAVYTHYIFQNSVHIIHIVIFYERRGKYLWHGSISNSSQFEGDERVFLSNAELHEFTKHAGLYDSLEVIKVTVDGLRLRAPRYPDKFLRQLTNSRFQPCNHTVAALFTAHQGPPDGGNEAVTFQNRVTNILYVAKLCLDKLGIPFWLSSGTCLGWYRQCGAIPYSKDADIGIWIKDYTRLLIPSMQENGLKLKHVFGKEEDSYELSFENDGIKLDIFFFYEEETFVWNGGTQARTGKKFKYVFPKFTLCWTEFLALKVRVPCEIGSYLEANYGKNWFIPVKEWDWKISPPNVRENGQWPPHEWNQVIQIMDGV